MSTSILTTIATFLKNLTFNLLNKFLKLVLPIPLFPTVSSVLAQALHIDPLTLKPFSMPNIPTIPSFVPFSRINKPVVPEIGQLRKDFRKGVQGFVSEGEAIPLLEKVRTWRASNQDAQRQWEEKRKNREREQAMEKDGRKRIDQVEFEGGIPETKSIIKDVKDSFEEVVPKVYIPFSAAFSPKPFLPLLSLLYFPRSLDLPLLIIPLPYFLSSDPPSHISTSLKLHPQLIPDRFPHIQTQLRQSPGRSPSRSPSPRRTKIPLPRNPRRGLREIIRRKTSL